MTSTVASTQPATGGVGNPYATGVSVAQQVVVLVERSIRGAMAKPSNYMPGVIMPLMLLTINSQGLHKATSIPGFPTDRFLDFLLVITFMQAALFATSSSGLGLARDIESGFLDRLALTPMRAGALVAAQISGAVFIAFASSLIYIVIGLVTRVDFESGLFGVLTLIVLASWTAFTFASVGAWIALRSGNSEALQGIFPLLFATLFLSTINMPRNLIQADWFRAITRVNPVSYMVDGMRSLIITGWNATVLAEDVAVLTVISLLAVWGCSRALRRHMEHS